MGKSRPKTFENQSSISRLPKASMDSERPDPKSSHFYNDEVDEFINDREMIPLRNSKRRRQNSSDEEVYKVAVGSEEENGDDDDDEVGDYENDNESEEDSAKVDPVDSDIVDETDEENYLPSANAWGKKKKDFYSTDYVDKDYGGNLSESDEEAACLEEIEAKALQKNLADHMTEEDFALILPTGKANLIIADNAENIEKCQDHLDVTHLSNEEKLTYLKRKHPEFIGLLQDFMHKKQTVENEIKPIVIGMDEKIIPRTASLKLIQLRYEVYENYLLNVSFYLVMMAEQRSLKGHPVIDRIVEWRKRIDIIDKKCENLMDDSAVLLDMLKNASSDIKGLLFVEKDEDNSTNVKGKQNDRTRIELSEESSAIPDELCDFGTPVEDDNAKRAATYEILKNKGSTPHRKKEDRNPRVKHKRKYQKALHKKRSQVPDVRKELSKYDGEIRGIKANVIKSVKLH